MQCAGARSVGNKAEHEQVPCEDTDLVNFKDHISSRYLRTSKFKVSIHDPDPTYKSIKKNYYKSSLLTVLAHVRARSPAIVRVLGTRLVTRVCGARGVR